MLFQLLIVAASIGISVQQLGCNSVPMPDLNGACPQEPHSLLEVVVALMETFSVRISDIAGFMNQIISAITTTSTAAAAVTTTRTSVTSGTCVDLTNPSTGTSDCTRMASYCFNSFYLTLMRQQCPRTCGYCTGTATTTRTSATCVDLTNPTTGVSDCTRMASYCNNSAYITLMRQQCPRTCGYCSGSGVVTTTRTSTTCADLVNPNTGTSDCTAMRSYCNNSAYATLMRQQCPRTCGYCTSG